VEGEAEGEAEGKPAVAAAPSREGKPAFAAGAWSGRLGAAVDGAPVGAAPQAGASAPARARARAERPRAESFGEAVRCDRDAGCFMLGAPCPGILESKT